MNTPLPNVLYLIRTLAVTLLAVLSFSAPAMAAGNVVPPDKLITNLFNEVTARVKKDEAKVAADKKHLITIGNEVLVPYVSFETMAKQILGKNWRKISADQQKRYSDAFRERVSVSIVNQYDPAKEYDLKVTGSRLNDTGDRAAVNSEVVERQSAKKYLISYKLYLDKKTTRWQVYDVAVEGVSVLQSFKTAGAEDFKRNGIEYMIAQLQNAPVVQPQAAGASK